MTGFNVQELRAMARQQEAGASKSTDIVTREPANDDEALHHNGQDGIDQCQHEECATIDWLDV